MSKEGYTYTSTCGQARELIKYSKGGFASIYKNMYVYIYVLSFPIRIICYLH